MIRLLVLSACLWVFPAVFSQQVQAGHSYRAPSECTGFYGSSNVLCMTTFTPGTRDQMPIWDVDEMGAFSASVRSSLVYAQDRWNDIAHQSPSAGPYLFSLARDINSTHNCIKPKNTIELCNRVGPSVCAGGDLPLGLTLRCHENLPGDNCSADLGDAVNAQWTEVWLNADQDPLFNSLCIPCGTAGKQRNVILHEFGTFLD